MKYYIADIHLHSKYSRATSPKLNLDGMVKAAKEKGVNLLGTSDCTNSLWLAELESYLEYDNNGIYKYKGIDFILTSEISLIFTHKERLKKIHIVIGFPEFKFVKEFNKYLMRFGKLDSDGRPTLGMNIPRLMKILFSTCDDAMLIPAHIWTPWFSLFGSNSGFDDIFEAFGEYTDKITALETGLSSDPDMNWRLSQLDRFSLVSNSDAHSLENIGREANVFSEQLNYYELKNVLEKKDKRKFLFTIEFFPEEGKYHYDGHRNCNVRLHPKESIKNKNICPVCNRPITIGVLHRVEELSDRDEGFKPENSIPFKRLIPLRELIALTQGKNVSNKSVMVEYEKIVQALGDEFSILLKEDLKEIQKLVDYNVFKGIKNMLEGKIEITPGYDGMYGQIKIFKEDKIEKDVGRRSLF